MADKKTYTKITTPKGTTSYPFLVFGKPDKGFAKTPTSAGQYRTNLVMPLEDATDLMKTLDEMAQGAYNEAKANLTPAEKAKIQKGTFSLVKVSPYEMEVDPHTGQETGNVLFKFSTSAEQKDAQGNAKPKKLPMFDAKGLTIPHESVNVGPGSTVRVAFQAAPYVKPESDRKKAGVVKYLSAIQVIELVESGGGSASFWGFGDEGEGFSKDTVSAPSGSAPPAHDDNDFSTDNPVFEDF